MLALHRGTAIMDYVTVPSLDVIGFGQIARGVQGLRNVMVNVFAIGESGGWVLLDTGLPMSASRIRTWAEQQFGAGARPKHILLTHGHFDHVGNVRALADGWDVPVYAHPLEMPYLTGRSKYPPPDPSVGGGVLAVMAPLYPRGPIDISSRLRPLPDDFSVPGLPGWRWIHTPGHTAGHVSYFREEDRLLIAGDAFTTTKQESATAVARQRPEFHGPPSYYTSDWDAAKLSVGRLAGLMPNVVGCGHGQPVAGLEVAGALRYLADNFDRVARPKRGRYVRTPAVADERGVVSVPPPVYSRARIAAVGGIIAAVLTYLIVRRRSA